jgi:uncharacterized protein with ParB-like and HNH nuclease domain
MSVGQILSMTSPPVIVPDWQRNYSWTNTEVETFWQDLHRFNDQYPGDNIDGQEYFLGAVVIVDTNQSHLLLDGQQRIATAAILISVIRDFLSKYSGDAATRVTTRYLTDYDDALEDYTFKITLNRYDRDFFKRLVLETKTTSWIRPEASYESHNLIGKSFDFFTKKMGERYSEINNQAESHQWALRILKVLTKHLSVVAVISTDEDNASSVFETLNDRGIGLSTTDLLRNLILRRTVATHLEETMDLWGEVLEIESDVKLQDFFRHFWISREGDVKARSLYREVRANIIDNDVDSLLFSRELRKSANVYQEILSANFGNDELLCKLLGDIGELGAKVLLPPTLSLLESKTDLEVIKKYLKYFISSYVRHSLVCKRENSLFENVMYSVAKSIRDGSYTDDQLLNDIKEFSPDDTTFSSTFATATITRRASARYILISLEMSLRITEELDVAPPNRVHVEHIYPQTPLQGNRLEQHASIIHRLGNMTLLSARLNTTIKNSAYEDKRAHYQQSELMLTRQLANNFVSWDYETIGTRQAKLSELCNEVWCFE